MTFLTSSWRLAESTTSLLSALARRPVLGTSNAVAAALAPAVQTRGKRTAKKGADPAARRIINILSLISAYKKQPRRLNLCAEELVRHNTVMAAWRIFLKDRHAKQESRLKSQYEEIENACNKLESLSPRLYASAIEGRKANGPPRFSLEMRVPTDTPPREPWVTNWQKPEPRFK